MEAFKLVVAQKDGTNDVFVSCIAAKRGFKRRYRIGRRTYSYKETPVLVFDTLESAARFSRQSPFNINTGRKIILRGEVPDDAERCRGVTFISDYDQEDILAFWRESVRRIPPCGQFESPKHGVLSIGGAPAGTLAAKWFKPLAVVAMSVAVSG